MPGHLLLKSSKWLFNEIHLIVSIIREETISHQWVCRAVPWTTQQSRARTVNEINFTSLSEKTGVRVLYLIAATRNEHHWERATEHTDAQTSIKSRKKNKEYIVKNNYLFDEHENVYTQTNCNANKNDFNRLRNEYKWYRFCLVFLST